MNVPFRIITFIKVEGREGRCMKAAVPANNRPLVLAEGDDDDMSELWVGTIRADSTTALRVRASE